MADNVLPGGEGWGGVTVLLSISIKTVKNQERGARGLRWEATAKVDGTDGWREEEAWEGGRQGRKEQR